MHWTFAASLEFTISFLESSFKQDPRFTVTDDGTTKPEFFHSSNNNNDDDDDGSSFNKKQQQKLDHAFKFMELTPPVTQEELKKKYKKLSLRYHPDRNGGSPESQQQMQILNACMEIIEKDLAGVDDDDNNDDDGNNAQQHHDHEEDEEEEDPMEKYKRMRKEREEAMREEMKRQQEMREAFVKNKDQQKKECEKLYRELKLDTYEGRDKSNKRFVQEVEKKTSSDYKAKKASPSKSNTDNNNNNSMGDIDDDDDNKKHQQDSSKTNNDDETFQKRKPQDGIMECNSNDFVIALRMGLPDIAISVVQNQIQDFFKESALNMHFEGETKTPSQLKLEFLHTPIDDDGNTILHYSTYYECYQTIKVISNVAWVAATTSRQYDAFEDVLTQTNYHNQTPYYFAKISQDASIYKLMESQLELSKIIKQRTMVFPALKAGGKRILGILQHIGFATTLTTIFTFVTAHKCFYLSKATSLFALAMKQVMGKDLPDVRGVSVFLSFCVLWRLATFIYVEFLKDYIMVELVLVLAPIVLAGLVSSRRKHWLLLPFQTLSIWLSKILNYMTPKPIAKRGMTQLFFLTITMGILFGIKKI